MADDKRRRKRRQSQRASPEEQTASAGIAAVAQQFALMNWGPVENTRHDLGTDLFVQVRDKRFFDLGLVVGAQVKTGPSYFDEPSVGPKQPEGWWYREEDKGHTDLWASHGLPHLLILHDLETHKSYWVHVTPEGVVDTGQGAKILVPEANTVDSDHVDELLAIAGTGRPEVQLEGTVWRGAAPPATADRLRFALLVPRLIAPHPNAGRQSELTPVQGTALLMQARFMELNRYAEEVAGVPVLWEAHEADDWGWRLVGALGAFITEGDLDPMRAMLGEAPDAAGRAAASVIVASALIEQADVDEALQVLDDALLVDEAAPVDDAWLRLQRARALLELGRVDEARAEATRVQDVRTTAGHDVTATAITGAAATMLFNTAGWAERDLSQAIEGSDTVAAWWRTQTTSRGVSAIVERTFKEWAADETVTFGGSDEANNQLFVAALTASHLGDQATWRRLTSLLGKDSVLRLTRRSDSGDVTEALNTLRRAGDQKAVGLATRRIADNGPAVALKDAGSHVDLETATRTTVLADISLVSGGGDLLDPDDAERAGRWIVSCIDQPERLQALASTRFGSVEAELVKWLSGLMTVVPDLGIELALDRLSTITETQESLRTQAWRALLPSIPGWAWTENRARALETPGTLAPDVRTAALGIKARFDSAAREALVAEVAEGSLRALGHLGDVAALDPAAAESLMSKLTPTLDRNRQEAAQGKLGFGNVDVAQSLAVLVSHHQRETTIDALMRYLGDPVIPRLSKRGPLTVFAVNRELFDPAVRERLVEVAQQATSQRSGLDGAAFGGDPDISAETRFIVGAHARAAEVVATEFSAMLAGPARHRLWAARLAGATPEHLAGVLPAMIQDDHPRVRAAAAAEIAKQVGQGAGGAVAAAALRTVAADPGREPPLAVAAIFADHHWQGDLPRELLESLQEHASAAVRGHAAQAVERASQP